MRGEATTRRLSAAASVYGMTTVTWRNLQPQAFGAVAGEPLVDLGFGFEAADGDGFFLRTFGFDLPVAFGDRFSLKA